MNPHLMCNVELLVEQLQPALVYEELALII